MEIKELFKKIYCRLSSFVEIDKVLAASDRKRLKKMPRFQAATVSFFGRKLTIVDQITFLSSYDEIFNKEIYKFTSSKKIITIIDCGANIGLASLYFKKIFPNAQIVAYEPDPNIFRALKENMLSFGYSDVICKNEAVSTRDGMLNFLAEGGHSGMIANDVTGKNVINVSAVRLKTLLQAYDHIVFLKIDIEGEEINVVPDIADELKKIDYLFLEYHSFVNSAQGLDLLLSIVKGAGMRYYIKEAASKQFPFMETEIFLGMDMLINIFCFREG